MNPLVKLRDNTWVRYVKIMLWLAKSRFGHWPIFRFFWRKCLAKKIIETTNKIYKKQRDAKKWYLFFDEDK